MLVHPIAGGTNYQGELNAQCSAGTLLLLVLVLLAWSACVPGACRVGAGQVLRDELHAVRAQP